MRHVHITEINFNKKMSNPFLAHHPNMTHIKKSLCAHMRMRIPIIQMFILMLLIFYFASINLYGERVIAFIDQSTLRFSNV